jgi:hypothetical protein
MELGRCFEKRVGFFARTRREPGKADVINTVRHRLSLGLVLPFLKSGLKPAGV